MTESNLPVPDPQGEAQREALEILIQRKRSAAMAEGLLKFRREADIAFDGMMVDMLRSNSECGFNKFTTPNGRPCIVIFGIGNGPVGLLTDMIHKITDYDPEKD